MRTCIDLTRDPHMDSGDITLRKKSYLTQEAIKIYLVYCILIQLCITILGVIHRPVLSLKRNVQETGFCLVFKWNLLSWVH
jgi:hypothetical protein